MERNIVSLASVIQGSNHEGIWVCTFGICGALCQLIMLELIIPPCSFALQFLLYKVHLRKMISETYKLLCYVNYWVKFGILIGYRCHIITLPYKPARLHVLVPS